MFVKRQSAAIFSDVAEIPGRRRNTEQCFVKPAVQEVPFPSRLPSLSANRSKFIVAGRGDGIHRNPFLTTKAVKN